MGNRKILLQTALFVALSSQLVLASEYDKDPRRIDYLPVAKAAPILCGPHNVFKQVIAKIQTFRNLISYLSQSAEPEMIECWSKYGESMQLLERVVSASTKDACSEEKISLIEQFHHRYLSQSRRDLEAASANPQVAPQMVIAYFIYYTLEIAEKCHWLSTINLNEALNVGNNRERTTNPAMDQLIDRFAQSFDYDLKPENQRFMFLMWSVVDDFAHESSGTKGLEDFLKYVSLADDLTPQNRYRLTIKTSDGDSFHQLQSHCRLNLQPIYSRTVLPVIRLIQLGYYLDELKSIPERWFKIAHLCETILPVRLLADKSLTEGQVVLIPKEEAMQMVVAEEEPASDIEPFEFERNVYGREALSALYSDHQKKTKQILADIKGRVDVVKRYTMRIAPKIMMLNKTKQSSFFLGSAKSHEDLTGAIGQSLTKMGEPTRGEKAMIRAKSLVKGLWSGIKTLSLLCVSPFILVGSYMINLGDALAGFHNSLPSIDMAKGYDGMSLPMKAAAGVGG